MAIVRCGHASECVCHLGPTPLPPVTSAHTRESGQKQPAALSGAKPQHRDYSQPIGAGVPMPRVAQAWGTLLGEAGSMRSLSGP